MHNASINEEVTEATNPRGSPSHHDSDATIIKSFMACIKGFIDMVKGLLAWFIRVLRSSGPSPSTPSTSSTNVGNKHNKQHNKAGNKSALKI